MPARAAAIAPPDFLVDDGRRRGARGDPHRVRTQRHRRSRGRGIQDGIALSLPGRVEVVQGATESIRITADDNVLPEIQSVVEGGILKLRFRDRFTSVTNARIRVIVNAKAIESLAIAGSGDIRYYGDPLVERSLLGSGNVRRLGAAPS